MIKRAFLLSTILLLILGFAQPAAAALGYGSAQRAAVVDFMLVNADTNRDIRELRDGDTINFAELGTRNLNIRANTNPREVTRVRFEYNGNSNYKTERVWPYALGGDGGGNYLSWTPALGAHTLRAIPYADGQEGRALSIRFTVVDNAAQPTATPTSPQPTATPAPTLAPTSTPGPGDNNVRYKYFEGDYRQLPNFGKLMPKASGETVGFTLSMRQRDDDFALQFESCLTIDTAGSYTFFTNSDDGTQLFVGGELVVTNDGLHPARERSGSISLEAGRYPIEVTFFERKGQQVLDVRYRGPGIGKRLIPSSKLSLGGCDDPLPSDDVSGFIFIDENGNTVQDENEPGLADVRLTLTDLDSGQQQVVITDADGYYAFGGLRETGFYFLSVALPAGYEVVDAAQLAVEYGSNVPALGVVSDTPNGTLPNVDTSRSIWLPLVNR